MDFSLKSKRVVQGGLFYRQPVPVQRGFKKKKKSKNKNESGAAVVPLPKS